MKIQKWYSQKATKKMNKTVVAVGIIAVLLVSLFAGLVPSSVALPSYTITDNTVWIDDANVYMSATPHTISSGGWVYFDLTPKNYNGDIDSVWGFNTSVVKPSKAELYSPHWDNRTTQHSQFFQNVSSFSLSSGACDFGNSYNPHHYDVTYETCDVWNEISGECESYKTVSSVVCFDSYLQEGSNYTAYWHTDHSKLILWKDISSSFTKINYDYGGMNTWYYVKNVPVVAGNSYQVRAWVDVPISTDGVSGKYWWTVKPSSETIAEAIASGHWYALDPWYSSSWLKRKQVTWTNVNATTLTNFPAYTNVTDEPEMQTDWDDVVFTDSSGNLIAYELENYTTGFADYWVNISSLPASGTYTGWMYYGNDGASSQENPEGIYDVHTKMVHHMQDLVDSTSNDNDATNHGATYTSDGMVDGAYDFNGSSDYWDCGSDASLNITDALSIEAWVKTNSTIQQSIVSKWKFGDGWDFFTTQTIGKLKWLYDAGIAFESDDIIIDNNYHYVNFVRDGNTGYLYIDSILQSNTISLTGVDITSGADCMIGNREELATPFNGTIDKVIISSTARSADWINQSYQLVTNQSTYVTWGSEEVSNPVITLVSQTPSTLYQNSTGNFNVTWLVQHASDGLNSSSVAFIYTNYYTVDGSYNHSIRVPSNDRAAAYTNMSGEQILRADNRNGSLNFEDNTTITGGNVYEWGGGDENTSRMTVTAINSTHSYVYWNGTLRDTVFPSMFYLDRTEQENATMTQYGIYKDHYLLAKIWNVEAIEGHDDYIFTSFADTHLGAISPNKVLEIYYLNESYDPLGATNPEDSAYAFYLTSHNATSWVDYKYSPHNSTYIKAFTVNQSAIEEAGIEVTKTGYLYYMSSVASAKPYYLNLTNSASSCNRSFAENNVTYIGSSAPFSEYLYTPNIFVSDRHEGHQFQMKLFAADDNGYWGSSSLETTSIGDAYFPPTTPSISHFNYPIGTKDYDMDGYYSGTFNVGVGVATDPDGGTVTHNLTIHYANETIVAIINNTFTEADATPGDPHALISFNSTPYHSATDTYTMKVVATDDEGQTTSSWLGVNFTIDVNAPTITETARTPSSVLVGDSVTISCTVTDDVSGVKNVSVQIKDAKDRVVNYTMVEGANNSYSYEFTYTGKEGWYYIQHFYSYDNASNLVDNASTLSFSARGYSAGDGVGGGAGGEVPTPSPTPEVNVTVTPSPAPPLEWIRRPAAAISGRDAVIVVGGVVGATFVMLMLAILWNYNKKQKREGGWL